VHAFWPTSEHTAPLNKTIEAPDKANAYFLAGQNLALRDDDPDYPALVLGNYMLGGGFLNSRLAVRIRQKDGLSYGVGSSLSASPLDKSGAFRTIAIYAPQNQAKLEAAFQEEMARVLKDGFEEKEIAEAKSGWLQSRQVGRAQDAPLSRTLAQDLYINRTLAWDAELGLDGSQYQTVFNTQTGLGRRLVSVDAYVSAGNLRYASVFSSEPGPSWFAAHGQTGAQQAATQSGLSPGWRPAIVSAATVGGTTFYASMYINDPGVSWSPGRDLSYADYQTQFNTNGGQGRFPAYLDAYFDAGGTPRINAIFMSPSGGGVWGWHGATGRQNLSNGRRAANAGMIAETLAGVSNGGTTNIAAIWQQPTLLFAPAGPIAGRDCLSVNEPSDASGTWSDNYMCADRIQDMQLRWHTAGVGGLPNPTLQTCTQIIEPSDPDTWTDNFLCKPNANVLQLLWSSSGPQTRNELLCSQWYEPNDLADGWDNNYLCYGTVPNNDSCSDAIELPMESGAMTLTLSTDRATNSAPLTCFGNTSSPDVFFKFTLPSTQTVAIDTFGSNFDTMLGIGTSCGSAPTFCNDDSGSGLQSSITQVLSAGTYYVVVEGFGSNHGDVTLHVNHF
jgi:hypothetical protein